AARPRYSIRVQYHGDLDYCGASRVTGLLGQAPSRDSAVPQRNPAGNARETSRSSSAPSPGRGPDGADAAAAPRADAPTVPSWRRVNRMGMGNSAIEPRPITSLASPGAPSRGWPPHGYEL